MIVPPTPPSIIYWPALVLFIIPILLSYLPFWLVSKLSARKTARETGLKPQKWLVLSFALLLNIVLYIALADLTRVVLKHYWTEENLSIWSYDQFVKSLSARIVVVLLGLPLLAGTWYKATGKAKTTAQEKSEVLTRKYCLSLLALVLGIVAIVSLGVCLYHLFNWALGVSEFAWSDLSAAISYGGIALAFLVCKLFLITLTKKNI